MCNKYNEIIVVSVSKGQMILLQIIQENILSQFEIARFGCRSKLLFVKSDSGLITSIFYGCNNKWWDKV